MSLILLGITIALKPIVVVIGWIIMILAGLFCITEFLNALGASTFGGRSGSVEGGRSFIAFIVFAILFYFLVGVNIHW